MKDRLELRQFAWFDQEMIDPALDRAATVSWLGVSGHRDDERAAELGMTAQIARDIEAIDLRQADVEENGIGPVLAGGGEGAWAVMGEKSLVSPELNERCQADGGIYVVIDYENAKRLRKRPPHGVLSKDPSTSCASCPGVSIVAKPPKPVQSKTSKK
jgi:hypothetical protein